MRKLCRVYVYLHGPYLPVCLSPASDELLTYGWVLAVSRKNKSAHVRFITPSAALSPMNHWTCCRRDYPCTDVFEVGVLGRCVYSCQPSGSMTWKSICCYAVRGGHLCWGGGGKRVHPNLIFGSPSNHKLEVPNCYCCLFFSTCPCTWPLCWGLSCILSISSPAAPWDEVKGLGRGQIGAYLFVLFPSVWLGGRMTASSWRLGSYAVGMEGGWGEKGTGGAADSALLYGFSFLLPSMFLHTSFPDSQPILPNEVPSRQI